MGGGLVGGCWIFTKLMQSHLPTKVEVEIEDELGNKQIQSIQTKQKDHKVDPIIPSLVYTICLLFTVASQLEM